MASNSHDFIVDAVQEELPLLGLLARVGDWLLVHISVLVTNVDVTTLEGALLGVAVQSLQQSPTCEWRP